MPSRFLPIQKPVTFTFEGESIQAEEGEPAAVSLVGAGHIAYARSPKFHRPRGPACLRGACDGCLARVDDVPNVMTCLVPARSGLNVAAQNTLGSKDLDLLRMTDWFFPSGMNHHELFAGVPGLQPVMQAFARRVAGLGRLPKEALAPKGALRRSPDVVVVGAGPSGLAAALAAADAGRAVEVVDEGLAPGGSILALAGRAREPFAALLARFHEAVASGRVRFRPRTVAGGFFGEDLLVASESGAEVLTARATVLATGAHDGVLAFEGNDLPGVVSARAAGFFLARGVTLGKRIVVVAAPGSGPFGRLFAEAVRELGAPSTVELLVGEPLAAHGTSRVKAVRVRTTSGEIERDADVLVVDAPPSPSYELAAQAGAELVPEERGFVVKTSEGRIGPAVFAVGEVTGVPFDVHALEENARAVVAAFGAG